MKEYIDNLPSKFEKHQLLKVLQEFQDEFGYIDQEFIHELSKRIKIPAGKIYGIASFYNQFRFHAKGKFHIKICNGASCHVNSEPNLINEIKKITKTDKFLISSDGTFSIEQIACMGACAKGPIMAINEIYYTELNIDKVKIILSEYLNK